MAPEIQKQEENKREFIDKFTTKYESWLIHRHIKNEDFHEKTYLSAGTLKKREKNEPDEDDRVETDSKVPDHEIYGFENEIKSLKNFLLDQKVYKEFKTLVIVGEYGVGKTALCKKIFNDDDVKSVYAPRIWVSMKNTVEGEDKKISVLKRILKELGVEEKLLKLIHDEVVNEVKTMSERGEIGEETEIEKEKEISALLYALHLNLKWKKYLIVFDDVRQDDNWNEMLHDDEEKLKKDKKWGKYLSDGFPKGSGGRIIYTTRDETKTLAKKLVAEEHEIHRLWPLTDSQSVWNIYESARKENGEDEPPRNDKKCIDELMNKSRGLPLAIRLMATLLPVFLDDETAVQTDSNRGTTDSVNNYA